jgi:hypothetical protein
MPDDKLQLEIDVINQAAVDRLKGSIEGIKDEMVDLTRAFSQGKSAPADYTAEMVKLGAELKREQDLLEGFTEDLEAVGGEGKKGAGRGTRAAVSGIDAFIKRLEGKRGLEGALEGAGGAISRVALSLGAGGVMATALGVMIESLPKLTELVNEFWDALTGKEKQGPEITIKALDTVAEKMKKISDTFKELMEKQPPEKAEAEKGFKEFLEIEGTGKVTGGLAQALLASRRVSLTAEEEATLRKVQQGRLEALGPIAGIEGKELKEIEEQLKKDLGAKGYGIPEIRQAILNRAAFKKAATIVGQVPTERGARDTLRAMATRYPGMFPTQLAGDLAEMEPEVQHRKEMAEQQEMVDAEARKEARERRDALNKRVNQLNLQGQENARHMRDQQERERKHDADRAKQDAAKAKHFREASGRAFERFEHLPATTGFPGLDVTAAEYAAVPRAARRQYEQKVLIPGAAEALIMQHPQMPQEEIQQRAAQYPAFLQQRYRGMRAEAVGAARLQGIDIGQLAQMTGESEEAILSNAVANQATQQMMERLNKNLRHLGRQGRQQANGMGKMVTKTESFLDSQDFE